MKVNGVNEHYFVEIKRENKQVFIIISEPYRRMCIGITDEDWERIKKEL